MPSRLLDTSEGQREAEEGGEGEGHPCGCQAAAAAAETGSHGLH